jgi:molecular chaperone GrpE
MMMKKKKPEQKKEQDKAQAKDMIDEYKNKYLRVLADFDNFKKRSVVERDQFAKFANEEIIAELLPVLDGFSRAIEAANKAGSGEEMLKGIELIKKQFEDTLKKHEVEEIEAVGKPYDANVHEAIVQKEDHGPEGIVLEELQKGYKLNDKVIRPSIVIVSKKIIVHKGE